MGTESRFGEASGISDHLKSGKEKQREERNIMSDEPEKMEWPEVVGMTADEAKEIILRECGGCTVEVIPKDAMVTMDYRTDRVRIRVDEATGKVAFSPRIG